jgi:hypothetical protein
MVTLTSEIQTNRSGRSRPGGSVPTHWALNPGAMNVGKTLKAIAHKKPRVQ